MGKKTLVFFLLILTLSPNLPYPSPLTPIFTMGNPDEKPDLHIWEMQVTGPPVNPVTFFPAKPIVGYRAIMSVLVENTGHSTARPVVVLVKWGCQKMVNSTSELAAGSSTTVMFYPLFLHAGNHSFEITVDPYNEVDEANETNNEITWKVEVALPSLETLKKASEQLNFEEEEGFWGGQGLKVLREELPIIHGIPNYELMGRVDPSNPSSDFEEQEGNGCGTTSLASILRYLRGRWVPTQRQVDREIRGGGILDIYTDPFSIAHYAKKRGLEARVYVNGDFEQVKWFIDRGIPVMICITVDGGKKVMKAHWVVPVAYWVNSSATQGLSSPVIIGYYNPWGYQRAIPQSRFEFYWGEQELGGVHLWNRVYVAICRKDQVPPDMPPSNAPKFIGGVMKAFDWSLAFLGRSLGYFSLENILKNPFSIFLGFFATIGAGICVLATGIAVGFTWLGKATWKGLKWLGEKIWNGIKSLACKWFGWGCKKKKEYFYYFYSTSPSAETPWLLNGMVKLDAVGYLFDSPGEDRVPIYEYADVDVQTYEVKGFFISLNPNVPETGVPGLRRYPIGVLGYGLAAPSTSSDVNLTNYFVGLPSFNRGWIGFDESTANVFIPQYYSPGSRILWLFNASELGSGGFLSTDEAAGTHTFPYVASDEEGEETGFHFTRNYVIGYINYNPLPGTVPLYRFYDSKEEEFYLTTNLEDEPKELRPVREMVFSGLVGYILEEQKPGTLPLYRYHAKEKGADYLFTTKEITSDKFKREAVIGYVYQYKEDCNVELWLYCFRKVK